MWEALKIYFNGTTPWRCLNNVEQKILKNVADYIAILFSVMTHYVKFFSHQSLAMPHIC